MPVRFWGRTDIPRSSLKGTPTIPGGGGAWGVKKKCNICPAGVGKMLQGLGAGTCGYRLRGTGARAMRLLGGSQLKRRCLLHREAGGPRRPRLCSAWHPGLGRIRVGGPGSRSLTRYLTWHQVSRGQGRQWARVVREPAPRSSLETAPGAAPARLLPPLLPRPAQAAPRQGRS